MLKNATWTLSSFYHGKPQAPFKYVFSLWLLFYYFSLCLSTILEILWILVCFFTSCFVFHLFVVHGKPVLPTLKCLNGWGSSYICMLGFLPSFSLCIILKSWKPWDHFVDVVIQKCMIHIEVHSCFTFSFNNYILKFNGQLNNTLFMFWKMNIKLKSVFLNYKSWLQIVLDLLNVNMFHMKDKTSLCILNH
jgi:hypothetical protein